MDWVCSNCGKKIFVRNELIEGLCVDCYNTLNQTEITSDDFIINLCSICFSNKIKDKWVSSKSSDFELVLEEIIPSYVIKKLSDNENNSNVKIIPHLKDMYQKSKSIFKIPVTIITSNYKDDEGNLVINQRDSEVTIQMVVCGNCSKVSRGSYEAILQIRVKNRKINETENKLILDYIMDRIEKKYFIDKNRVITKLKETKTGIDIYFVSNNVAKNLAADLVDRFGCYLKESKKLAGKNKSGKTIYRTAYSLRLPVFRIGDIFDYEDHYYLINNINNGRVAVLDLNSNNTQIITLAEAWKIENIIPMEYLSKFVIVALEGDILDIMNLNTYETYIINKPAWDMRPGQEVKGFFTESDELIIIP